MTNKCTVFLYVLYLTCLTFSCLMRLRFQRVGCLVEVCDYSICATRSVPHNVTRTLPVLKISTLPVPAGISLPVESLAKLPKTRSLWCQLASITTWSCCCSSRISCSSSHRRRLREEDRSRASQ